MCSCQFTVVLPVSRYMLLMFCVCTYFYSSSLSACSCSSLLLAARWSLSDLISAASTDTRRSWNFPDQSSTQGVFIQQRLWVFVCVFDFLCHIHKNRYLLNFYVYCGYFFLVVCLLFVLLNSH